MSTFVYANAPAGFLQPAPANFTATNTTVAKVVVDTYPAAIATTTTPQYYGGCTAIDLVATSTDSVARAVMVYDCAVSTTQDPTFTGVMTTTTSTIPRTTGSFVTDGWLVGDQVMTFSPSSVAPNAAVDGIVCIVTAVTALGLTLNGTPIAALTLGAATRICKVRTVGRFPIAITAGTDGATANVNLIGSTTLDKSLLTTEVKLGASNLIAIAMQATISALPAVVSIGATVARY